MDKMLLKAVLEELEEYENWLTYLAVKGNPSYQYRNSKRLRELQEVIKGLKEYGRVA